MGLVEVNVVEQRCRGVIEVVDQGATVTDVAARYGVSRQAFAELDSSPAAGRASVGW